MIRYFVALWMIIFAIPLAAQSNFPALFDVTDVAANDTLNVRAQPDVAADIIGELDPSSSDVEVFGTDPSGNWAHVNILDQAGWVAIRFLKAQPVVGEGGLPETLHCAGTEPFWSLSAGTGGAIYNAPDTGLSLYGHGFDAASSNRTDRFSRGFAGKAGGLFATIEREQCSDGMSDRLYGWSIDAILAKNGLAEATMISGCCSLTK
ncbi:MAG: SH3 domain-containing protein [Pseudomonadota bacterium]